MVIVLPILFSRVRQISLLIHNRNNIVTGEGTGLRCDGCDIWEFPDVAREQNI
jgi:hypothetical protein